MKSYPGAGFTDLSFFSFTPIGIVCVLVGIIVLIPLSKWFLIKKDEDKNIKSKSVHSSKELINKYQLSDNLYRLLIKPGSKIGGKKLHELNITSTYALSILEIRRQSSSQGHFFKTVDQSLAGAETQLQENDILYVFGTFENVRQFAKEHKLELTDTGVSEYIEDVGTEKLSVREIGIAEVLLMPDSKLINKAIKDSDFRQRYAVNVLGIQRKGEYILNDIKKIKMHSGDILLIQGTWDCIAQMSKKQSEWVVLGQPLEEASKVTLDYKAP